MKTVGLVGGIGPASTMDYYAGIIRGCRAAKDINQYPHILIDSINMTEMLYYFSSNQKDRLIMMLLKSLERLQAAGAEVAAMASNTPHIVFDEVKKRTELPLVNIVEETCKAAVSSGIKRVTVLGTMLTMKSGLYSEAFEKYGISAYLPNDITKNQIQEIIFPNLEDGIIVREDKIRILEIANELVSVHNAEALVLGCTELPIMIRPGDIDIPLLNTTQIHVDALIREMIS